MSLPRFALWGGLGGLLFSGLFVPVAGLGWGGLLLLGPIFGLSGAACAAGSLAVARKARELALLEDGGNAAEPAGFELD